MSRTRSQPPGGRTPAESLLDPAICLGLVLAVFLVYGQVSHFDFIHFDDPAYVSQNDHVRAGLTLDSIRWAFTSVVVGNWSPVTLLSHILVYQFFGMSSGMHHLINVVIHALAAVALFMALRRATGSRWPSAFVAFLFALHPLHVESVAWVSERKDVLSAFFWFLTLYAYVRYVEQPSVRRYVWMAVSLSLGLMSKAMLVTLPFTLLLFDVWPLRRARFPGIVWEKLPLFGLCAASSIASVFAQQSAQAISTVSPLLRLENSLLSYITYIRQTFWPARLSWFYLYPDSIAGWQAAAAGMVVLGLSVLAIYTWRTRPYIATGWFWYLGTLIPVIGLVQVGAQAHADRYTYIPMTGLTILLAWGALDIVKQWPRTRVAIAVAGTASCLTCLALASTQASYWQDGSTLFQHGIDVSENDFWSKYNLALEHYTLGNEQMNGGNRAGAIEHFEKVLQLKPDWAEAHNNLAILLANIPSRSSEAVGHFEAAVHFNPDLAQAQRNLGFLLAKVPGKEPEAISHLEAAQRLQPDPETQKLLDQLRAGSK